MCNAVEMTLLRVMLEVSFPFLESVTLNVVEMNIS